MKAVAVVPGTKDSLHVRSDAPEPEPGKDEALVRVVEAGVCGTDVEIHQGLYGEAPPGSEFLILGHENLTLKQILDPSRLQTGCGSQRRTPAPAPSVEMLHSSTASSLRRSSSRIGTGSLSRGLLYFCNEMV